MDTYWHIHVKPALSSIHGLLFGLYVDVDNFIRAMDFLVELFRNLLEHQDWTMAQACMNSYSKTLKKFHGWIASSAFTVNTCIRL